MINKELKRLSRRELVDIIYQLKKNEQEMQEEIAKLQDELEDKRIRLSKAGSIADAALSITNAFSAAQTAADLYLHEISCMREEAEKECTRKIAEAEKVLANLKKKCKNEQQKYKRLQTKMALLQEKKKRESCEDAKND